MRRADIDIYPASLQVGEQHYPRVRVIVADGHLWAFRTPTEVVYQADVASHEPQRKPRGYSVVFTDEQAAQVVAGKGCGCGDPLKTTKTHWTALVEKASV